MKERGFTLLEVLVATTIMAFAVVGLLSTLSTSMRNASRLTDHDRAALLARRTMDELLLQERLPLLSALEGRYDPAVTSGLESGWRARVEPFEMPPIPAPGQYRVDRIALEVWWTTGGQRRTFLLEGFLRTLMRPEDVPQVAR